MKRLLAALLLTVSTTAYAEDTASVPYTPEGLGKLWAQAIKDNSTDELKKLIHPDCANGDIKPAIYTRMVSGGLPADYSFTVEDMTTPPEKLDQIFLVRPTKNLTIHYNNSTDEDKHKYGLGKGFPIAQKDGHWYFAVCAKH